MTCGCQVTNCRVSSSGVCVCAKIDNLRLDAHRGEAADRADTFAADETPMETDKGGGLTVTRCSFPMRPLPATRRSSVVSASSAIICGNKSASSAALLQAVAFHSHVQLCARQAERLGRFRLVEAGLRERLFDHGAFHVL